jgi:hypothetical protein
MANLYILLLFIDEWIQKRFLAYSLRLSGNSKKEEKADPPT